MNKGLRITLIALLSILLIFVVGIMVFLFKGDINLGKFVIAFGESKTLVDEKEIYNIKNLNIEANIADVLVETRENQSFIKVELYSDHADEYEITEKEDEIKVVLKDNKIIMFGNKGSRVKVYVPTTYDKDIKVVNRTGDIKIDELSNSDLDIKLTTGDIEVIEAKNIIASLTTGDVEINKAINADITATTGDITIGKVNGSLNLTSTTGDIEVNIANLIANSNIKSGTGDVEIKSTTGCYIDAKTNIGDTKVNNNDRKSDIVLTITSRVGDIRVNK